MKRKLAILVVVVFALVAVAALLQKDADATQLTYTPSAVDPCQNILNWNITLGPPPSSAFMILTLANNDNDGFVDNGEECIVITDVVAAMSGDEVCDADCDQVEVDLTNTSLSIRRLTAFLSDVNPVEHVGLTTGITFDDTGFGVVWGGTAPVTITVTGFQPEP